MDSNSKRYTTMHPTFLDKAARCATCVKQRVGRYTPKLINQGGGSMRKAHARHGHGSARSYLSAK